MTLHRYQPKPLQMSISETLKTRKVFLQNSNINL